MPPPAMSRSDLNKILAAIAGGVIVIILWLVLYQPINSLRSLLALCAAAAISLLKPRGNEPVWSICAGLVVGDACCILIASTFGEGSVWDILSWLLSMLPFVGVAILHRAILNMCFMQMSKAQDDDLLRAKKVIQQDRVVIETLKQQVDASRNTLHIVCNEVRAQLADQTQSAACSEEMRLKFTELLAKIGNLESDVQQAEFIEGTPGGEGGDEE
eukprot:TRINITY_DN1425_c0_g1_i1.p1 TRINITY_DN1425_c0_g1~~TRINITY_DN1425_c0_g1_i1.p1  ORF type:complete len:215 (+),score=51.64 TRINITY_DN1425_c0_g1_i1:53-697(+)